MKVLHINTFDHYGGAEKIAYTLYKALPYSTLLVKEKLKYKTDDNILEFERSIADKIILFVDKVLWKFGFKKGLKTYFQASDQLNGTYKKLVSLKAYQEADIVHLHNIHGSYFDLTAINRIAKEKRVVWTIHDMWPLTGGEAYLFSNDVIQLGRVDSKKALQFYPLNGPLVDKRRFFTKLKKNLYLQNAKNIFFTPVSNWLCAAFTQSKVYSESLKVQVIYNGIDTEKYIDHKKRQWATPRVLFFYGDSPFKGAGVFIDSLEKTNAKFELIVVGNKIDRNIPDNIKVSYRAKINEENKLVELFNTVDILVFPSLAEAFGLLPAEAMLCGVAILASDAGGLPEIVKEGETGFLFKNGNSEDLTSKLKYLIDNITVARKVGSESRNYVCENFSLSKMIQAYEKLYHLVSI